MKKIIFLMLMTLSMGASFAFYHQAGDYVLIDEVQQEDLYLAGESVSIKATAQEDVFIAGAQIDVDAPVWKDLFAVGSILTINGAVSDDLKAVGSLINLNANVGDDAFVVGSSITVARDVTINGSLIAAGEMINFDGKATKGARFYGDTVRFNGVVEADVVIKAKELTFTSDAQIFGNLKVSESLITSDLETIVQGEITPITIEFKGHTDIGKTSWFYSFGRMFLIAILLLFLMPKYFKNSTKTISKKPRKMLLYGFLLYVVSPIAIIILMITAIGAPLALFFLFLYIFLLAFTKLWVIVFGTGLIQKYLFKSKKLQENKRVKLAIIFVLSVVMVFTPFWIAWILSLFAVGAGAVNDMKMLKKYK